MIKKYYRPIMFLFSIVFLFFTIRGFINKNIFDVITCGLVMGIAFFECLKRGK